jgi:uncharacterized protein YqgV (UPF0045/DUF77 family)
LAYKKAYEFKEGAYEFKEGTIRTTMSGSRWRQLMHAIKHHETMMILFNMTETVWRIDIVYVS